jgi:hypothetical protein
MFVSIQIEKGHTVIPIDSILVIEDIDGSTCRVVYDFMGNRAAFDATERAEEICLRVNKILAAPDTALTARLSKVRV